MYMSKYLVTIGHIYPRTYIRYLQSELPHKRKRFVRCAAKATSPHQHVKISI